MAVPAGHRGSPEDLVRALRAEGIGDRRVLAAFRRVPRARFVPPTAAGPDPNGKTSLSWKVTP